MERPAAPPQQPQRPPGPGPRFRSRHAPSQVFVVVVFVADPIAVRRDDKIRDKLEIVQG